MSDIGYVVLEWNQASGRPSVARGGDIYDEEVDAKEAALGMAAMAARLGRRERYTVAALEDANA